MKHFISLHDVDNVQELVQEGIRQKANRFADQSLGKNKTIGLLFFNQSLF